MKKYELPNLTIQYNIDKAVIVNYDKAKPIIIRDKLLKIISNIMVFGLFTITGLIIITSILQFIIPNTDILICISTINVIIIFSASIIHFILPLFFPHCIEMISLLPNRILIQQDIIELEAAPNPKKHEYRNLDLTSYLHFKITIKPKLAILEIQNTQIPFHNITEVTEALNCAVELWRLVYFYAFTDEDGSEVLVYQPKDLTGIHTTRQLRITESNDKIKFATSQGIDNWFEIFPKTGQINCGDLRMSKRQALSTIVVETITIHIGQAFLEVHLKDSGNMETTILDISYDTLSETWQDAEEIYKLLVDIDTIKNVEIISKV